MPFTLIRTVRDLVKYTIRLSPSILFSDDDLRESKKEKERERGGGTVIDHVSA